MENSKEKIDKYNNQIEGINLILNTWGYINLIDPETSEKIEIELRKCRNVLEDSRSRLIKG